MPWMQRPVEHQEMINDRPVVDQVRKLCCWCCSEKDKHRPSASEIVTVLSDLVNSDVALPRSQMIDGEVEERIRQAIYLSSSDKLDPQTKKVLEEEINKLEKEIEHIRSLADQGNGRAAYLRGISVLHGVAEPGPMKEGEFELLITSAGREEGRAEETIFIIHYYYYYNAII